MNSLYTNQRPPFLKGGRGNELSKKVLKGGRKLSVEKGGKSIRGKLIPKGEEGVIDNNMLSIQVPFLNGLLYSKFVVLPKCLKMLSLLILLNCSEKYIILIPQIYFLKMYYITEKAESLFFVL